MTTSKTTADQAYESVSENGSSAPLHVSKYTWRLTSTETVRLIRDGEPFLVLLTMPFHHVISLEARAGRLGFPLA